MIIICPCGEKKFKVDENVIPETGRLLKCGSCDQTWFFNKKNQDNDKKIEINPQTINDKKEEITQHSRINETVDESASNLPDNKGSELIKYNPKSSFSFGKLLNYLLITIISFIALIIILDTFKNPLSVFFPNLELILYNLFETIKDLTLFAKDLK